MQTRPMAFLLGSPIVGLAWYTGSKFTHTRVRAAMLRASLLIRKRNQKSRGRGAPHPMPPACALQQCRSRKCKLHARVLFMHELLFARFLTCCGLARGFFSVRCTQGAGKKSRGSGRLQLCRANPMANVLQDRRFCQPLKYFLTASHLQLWSHRTCAVMITISRARLCSIRMVPKPS